MSKIIKTEGPAPLFSFDRQYDEEPDFNDSISVTEAMEMGFTDVMSDRTAE